MKLPYVVSKITNRMGAEPVVMYKIKAKRSGSVSTRDLATQISSISTLSSIDVLACIEAFQKTILYNAQQGKIVRLDGFGTFKINVISKAQTDLENVDAENIKGYKLVFSPLKDVRKDLASTESFKSEHSKY